MADILYEEDILSFDEMIKSLVKTILQDLHHAIDLLISIKLSKTFFLIKLIVNKV